jgi:D-lyxose ketol-isomerase
MKITKIVTGIALGGMVALTGLLNGGCSSMNKMDNSEFYANGELDGVKAKQAYFDLMNYHNFVIPESFKGDQLWCLDFGLGDFTSVGMGGVFWANENHEGGGYLGHEIFLLPGQMIPEHAHVKCDSCPPKRESWLVRSGSAYSFSVQEKATDFPDGITIPASQKGATTVNSCIKLEAGDLDTLGKAGSPHFLLAGPEGAIISEFATFHDNAGLRFTNKKVKF